MTQPTALYLADVLEHKAIHEQGTTLELACAAELRRLHELAMDQQGKIYALEMARSMEQKTAKLKRAALLAVLKDVGAYWAGGDVPAELDARMRDAIAKATGEV